MFRSLFLCPKLSMNPFVIVQTQRRSGGWVVKQKRKLFLKKHLFTQLSLSLVQKSFFWTVFPCKDPQNSYIF